MKYSLLSIAACITINLSSCLAAETDKMRVDTKKRISVDLRSSKRTKSLELDTKSELDSWDSHSSGRDKASRVSESQRSPMLNENKINEILNRKAQVLLSALPIVSKSLDEITKEIGNKVRAIQDHDFNRASEVAVVGSLGMSLRVSTNALLQKLKTTNGGNHSGLPSMAAVAIGGSGALKIHIMDLITKLESTDETKTINLKTLKAAIAEISSVTDDIDKSAFILSDEKY